MANYYYVKSGGTATGDAGRATTQRTGTFAAMGATAYYDNIQAAYGATTAPVAGDFGSCSHLHAKNYAVNTILNIPDKVVFTSVDDANADQQLAGAKEQATGVAYTFGLQGSWTSDGIDYEADGVISIGTGSTKPVFLMNSTLTSAATATPFSQGGAARKCIMFNVHMVSTGALGASTAPLGLTTQGAVLEMIGGSIAVAASPTCYAFAVQNSAISARLEGVAIDTDIVKLLYNNAAWNSEVEMVNCSTGALTTIFGGNNLGRPTVRIVNTSGTNGIIQRDEHYGVGELHTDTSTYITADGDKNGTDYSFKLSTGSASYPGGDYVRVPISRGWVDTATAKTFTTPILHDSVTALTDVEFWTELLFQDDLTTLGIIESDKGADLFTPANLAASTAVWTEALTNNNEQQSVITTVATGKPGYYILYACMSKTSYDVWVGKPVIT